MPENSRLFERRTVNGVRPVINPLISMLLILTVAGLHHLLHYTEPSADPIPATSTVSNTVLPLSTGAFTHNSAGLPIVVACTKADQIDEGHDLVAGASGMGGMVKGKGGEWEERTDGVMQIMRTICLKCELRFSLFRTIYLAQVLVRWRILILHHSVATDPPSTPTVCSARFVRSSCTFTCCSSRY